MTPATIIVNEHRRIPRSVQALVRGERSRRRTRQLLTVQELESRQLLTTFTVMDTFDDDNPGSLRYEIGQLDSDPDPAMDTIDFAIPGTGPFTINTYEPLPPISHSVLIDGYSQSGASVNTQTGSDNAVLMIDLDGTYIYNPTYGLDIIASGCTVQGLAITDYASGVLLDFQTSGELVQGNLSALMSPAVSPWETPKAFIFRGATTIRSAARHPPPQTSLRAISTMILT